MAKIHIQSEHDIGTLMGYVGPATLEGAGESQHLLSEELAVWLVVGTLNAGSRLTWPDQHGEEAVYVLDGQLMVDDVECAAGHTLVIERDAALNVIMRSTTKLVHFGTRFREDTSLTERGAVHVVGPGGRFRHETGLGSRVTWFADSTDATCDLSFFLVHRPPSAPDRGIPHTHSQDEVIFVLGGEVSLGAHHCRAGTAVGIPANVRYALSKSAEGFTFLNYRPGPSVQTVYHPGADPEVVPESGMERGGIFVGDVRTLTNVTRGAA